MLKKLKDIFHAALKKSGTLFYTKPQTYEVLDAVSLKNKGKQPENATVVIPMPQTTQSQTILSEMGVEKRETENTFLNTYQRWETNLAPGETKVHKTNFRIQITPSALTADQKKYTLKDYDTTSKIYTRYTTPRFSVSPDNKTIHDVAHKLAKDEENVYAIIQKFNEYVIKSLHYGNPIPGLYSAHETLKKDCVDCGGFSTVFASLCMSVGIPARVTAGFWAGYPKKYLKNDMHAWAQVLLPDGSWITVDPSTEKLMRAGRTRLFGKLGIRPSDRIVFSVGSDMTIGGERISILQNPHLLSKNPKLALSLTYTAKKLS